MFYVVQKIHGKNVKELACRSLYMDADEMREDAQSIALLNCTNSNAIYIKTAGSSCKP
jgi:hypothetical protein